MAVFSALLAVWGGGGDDYRCCGSCEHGQHRRGCVGVQIFGKAPPLGMTLDVMRVSRFAVFLARRILQHLYGAPRIQ